ncbi:MAG TPA: hypothetical protein VGI10_14195 [Polyangiaceae bacterium]
MVNASARSAIDVGRIAAGVTSRRPYGERWLLGFAIFQFVCQLGLLIPVVGELRFVWRTAAFLASIVLVVSIPTPSKGQRIQRSVAGWAYAVLGITALEWLHPGGTGLASLAQIAMYVAILGPTLWVPRLKVTSSTLGHLIVLMWVFYTASAALGVLQTYFPGHFEMPVSAMVAEHGKDFVRSLEIQLASGERVFRPMGLTDVPGGAASAGMYAVLLSVAIVQVPKLFPGARVLAVCSMMLGMICLYLCQVRAAIVTLGICLVAMIALLAVMLKTSRLIIAALAIAAVAPLAFALASAVGGHSVSERLSTLVENDAATVYYEHRGKFLEHTIYDLLPAYPLGAGLGRWGMIDRYLGAPGDSIYVEIQWTGWLLDGGLPLVLAYCALIAVASRRALTIAFRSQGVDRSLSVWACLVVAYNIGAAALCFSYAVFISNIGLEFWLLNASLLAVEPDQQGLAQLPARGEAPKASLALPSSVA